MSEFTEDFFCRCWIIFKTQNPRAAKKMDKIEAQVLGIAHMKKPEKENQDANSSDQRITLA